VTFPEANLSFPCFGAEANVHVGFAKSDPRPLRLVATRRPDTGQLVVERSPDGRARAKRAAAGVQRLLADVSGRLTRFDPGSELCALNRDPPETVPVSRVMARFVRSAIWAAQHSRGLFDAALLDARTALKAEVRAKAILLWGPQGAPSWLPHGGVVVLGDGTHALYPGQDRC
jgi:thiamine biosynthesis lipoprotein ApbE